MTKNPATKNNKTHKVTSQVGNEKDKDSIMRYISFRQAVIQSRHLTSYERLVLLVLDYHMAGSGEQAFPTLEGLIKETDASQSTIQRTIKSLVQKQWLFVFHGTVEEVHEKWPATRNFFKGTPKHYCAKYYLSKTPYFLKEYCPVEGLPDNVVAPLLIDVVNETNTLTDLIEAQKQTKSHNAQRAMRNVVQENQGLHEGGHSMTPHANPVDNVNNPSKTADFEGGMSERPNQEEPVDNLKIMGEIDRELGHTDARGKVRETTKENTTEVEKDIVLDTKVSNPISKKGGDDFEEMKKFLEGIRGTKKAGIKYAKDCFKRYDLEFLKNARKVWEIYPNKSTSFRIALDQLETIILKNEEAEFEQLIPAVSKARDVVNAGLRPASKLKALVRFLAKDEWLTTAFEELLLEGHQPTTLHGVGSLNDWVLAKLPEEFKEHGQGFIETVVVPLDGKGVKWPKDWKSNNHLFAEGVKSWLGLYETYEGGDIAYAIEQYTSKKGKPFAPTAEELKAFLGNAVVRITTRHRKKGLSQATQFFKEISAEGLDTMLAGSILNEKAERHYKNNNPASIADVETMKLLWIDAMVKSGEMDNVLADVKAQLMEVN